MKIIELRSENVKGIKAVVIHPNPNAPVVSIAGKNGQGKSSAIDSIWYAAGGGDAAPEGIIRDGQETASVFLDMGDVKIERSWKRGKDGKPMSTKLSVRDGNGIPIGSPQTALNRMFSNRCLDDPLAILHMKPAEQVAELKRVTGLDFADLDAEHKKLYQQRQDLNRRLRDADGALKTLPIIAAPDAEESVAAIAGEHAAASAKKGENDKRRAALEQAGRDFAARKAERQKTVEQIQSLQTKLAAQDDELKVMAESGNALGAAVAALVDPDLLAIQARLSTVETTNIAVRQKRARAEKADEVSKLQKESESYTTKLSEIDEQKASRIRMAKMPVPGLGFDDVRGIILNSHPLALASQAEQWRFAVALGLAEKPEARVILNRQGGLLDSESRAGLEKVIEEFDAQMWLECVTDGQAMDGAITIEDGEVKVG